MLIRERQRETRDGRGEDSEETRPWEDGGGDWSSVTTSHGTPGATGAGRGKEWILLRASGKESGLAVTLILNF